MISQESFNKRNMFGELSWSFSDLRWSYFGLLDISAGLSEISDGLPENAHWSLNELSMVSARKQGCCWSLNECSAAVIQRSPLISLKFAENIIFGPQWSLKDLQSVSTETNFFGILETAERSGQVLVSQRSPLCTRKGA